MEYKPILIKLIGSAIFVFCLCLAIYHITNNNVLPTASNPLTWIIISIIGLTVALSDFK